MMSRRTNKALTYAVFSLYAGTMLFGQGLHLLVCSDHDDAGHGHSGHGHSGHGSGAVISPAGDQLGSNLPSVGQSHARHGHDADCAICQFHGQGQVVSPAVEACVGPLAAAEVACLSSPLDLRRPQAVYSCRAPPRG